MFGQQLDQLNLLRIVLASGSPRRKEMLQQLGLNFSCQSSDYDESLLDPSDYESKGEYVMALAKKKVEHVKFPAEVGEPDLVIGADTIVVCDGHIFGKPETSTKALQMLQNLRGRAHDVFTGVALSWKGDAGREVDCFFNYTIVTLGSLSDTDIMHYINTGEPMDKAGAYGIQGLGNSFVQKIDGDFYSVAGFPVYDFCSRLRLRFHQKGGKF